jgi:hypothetical protein
MRQRPLASCSMHVRMHTMHAALFHPWIEALEGLAGQELLPKRWQRYSRARSTREQQQQQQQQDSG